jgi:2-polyprenyl-6-methoxyphenol hydroxylase-like FAD-dependent oxidoreductase
MAIPPLEVGIIGCGTAGAAAALFLGRAGHRVTVYERVPDPRPVGAGILLQPTGQAVLSRLGLLEPILQRGARIRRLLSETDRREPLVDLSYDLVGPEAFGVGLHRGVLFETLYRAACAEVTVRTGVEIARMIGRRLETADGERLGPFDLVVVADGAQSRLHAETPLEPEVSVYPWGALWFVADDPAEVFRDRLHQVCRGADRMCGLLPTGLGLHAAVPKVSLFWSLRGSRLEEWRTRGLDAWKADVLALEPRAGDVLAQIESQDDVLFATYRDVRLHSWHVENAVCLGDAAHATSPQLGQGANLALMDAMILADALAEAETLAAGLAGYSRRRRSQLGYYQLVTRWLTPFFQSDSRLLGWTRDLVFPLLRQVPYLQRMMARSMAGVQTGFFSPPLELAK